MALSVVTTPGTMAIEVAGRLNEEGGTLELVRLTGASLQTWTGDHLSKERLVRIWLPPEFSKDNTPIGGWPVVYLADGQNLFSNSALEASWNVASSATKLVHEKQLARCVIVGVDHAEVLRSYDYLPFAPGTGGGNFRPECAEWKGGGAQAYCEWIVTELMPALEQRYNLASEDPSRMCFGGSSFGGMITLFMAMYYPAKFGAMICLSPSFWAGEGRFLEDVATYSGAWPQRMYVSFGAQEYTYTRKNGRDDVDQKLVRYTESFISTMRAKGSDEDCLRYELCVGQEAGHTEKAWRDIFARALAYCFAVVP